MPKNTMSDLNNILFEQLERLNDTDLTGEKLNEEITRSRAVTDVAMRIIDNSNTLINAQKLVCEYGRGKELPMLNLLK